jgi:hypothetical protein
MSFNFSCCMLERCCMLDASATRVRSSMSLLHMSLLRPNQVADFVSTLEAWLEQLHSNNRFGGSTGLE